MRMWTYYVEAAISAWLGQVFVSEQRDPFYSDEESAASQDDNAPDLLE